MDPLFSPADIHDVQTREWIKTLLEYRAKDTDRRINNMLLREMIEKYVKLASKLEDSERKYRSVFTALGEGLVVQDRDGRIIASNKSTERILGLSEDELYGRTSVDPRWQAVHEDNTPFPGEDHPAMQTLRTGKPMQGVVMGVHKTDGTLSWIAINTQPMFHEGEKTPYAVVATFTDITERKLWEQELRRVSVTDHLTQIYNRVKGAQSLEAEIERAQRYKEPLSLIMFDIDHFKSVNDTYGHDVGDKVLVSVTGTVSRNLRGTDVFIRWGGEEFMIILPHTGSDDALKLAERFREQIESMDQENRPRVTVSLGVTSFFNDDSIDSLTKRVDEALYEAKRTGRNRTILQ